MFIELLRFSEVFTKLVRRAKDLGSFTPSLHQIQLITRKNTYKLLKNSVVSFHDYDLLSMF